MDYRDNNASLQKEVERLSGELIKIKSKSLMLFHMKAAISFVLFSFVEYILVMYFSADWRAGVDYHYYIGYAVTILSFLQFLISICLVVGISIKQYGEND